MAFLVFGIIILVLKRRARRRATKVTSSVGDTLSDFKSLGQRNILQYFEWKRRCGKRCEVGDLVAVHRNTHEEVYRWHSRTVPPDDTSWCHKLNPPQWSMGYEETQTARFSVAAGPPSMAALFLGIFSVPRSWISVLKLAGAYSLRLACPRSVD